MNRPWVAIQRNPTSGTGTRRGVLLELLRELKRRGITPRMFANRERMQAKLANPAMREHLVCVVAAGGEGTIGALVNDPQLYQEAKGLVGDVKGSWLFSIYRFFRNLGSPGGDAPAGETPKGTKKQEE